MVGREELVFQLAGDSRAASERRSETTVWGGESLSNVLGTNMQRLRPSATLAFFHLLAMVRDVGISLTPKMLQPRKEKAPARKSQISNGEKLRALQREKKWGFMKSRKGARKPRPLNE